MGDQLLKSHLRVDSVLSALDRVLDWFETIKVQACDDLTLSEQVWMQCQLALAEGFTNAVRHAHHYLPPETPIDLEVCRTLETLELRIWDCGEPFDLEDYLQKNDRPPDVFAEGGRGLYLMRTIATHLSYTRGDDGRNCLLILKKMA